MEVHAHTHTSRKKWTHYFWEFFMLFMAVTAGLLVENWRHHRLEKSYERQYMKSLVEDLESDVVQLNGLINLFTIVDQKEDSLIVALRKPDILSNAAAAYSYLGYPLDGYGFHRSERTIQQLKNAGGLRLIHSVEVSNKINEYDESFRKSWEISGVLISTYHQYTAALNNVADADLISFPYKTTIDSSIRYEWITSDPRELKRFFNYVVNFQWVTRIYMEQLRGLRKEAIALISFLKTEYKF